MIVSCPACATRFSLDATLLGPNGRNVRCAKCGHRWRQQAPAAAESTSLETVGADAAAAADAPPAIPAGMASPGLAALLGGRDAATAPRHADVVVPPKLKPATPARNTGWWPWVLFAGILCGLLAAAYFFRGPISHVIPSMDRLYSLVGLGPANPAEELQIGNLKSEQRSGLLAVRGDVFNPTETPLKMPPLLLVGIDANGKPLDHPLMFRTLETDIAPGETITFRILYDNAPHGMKSFRVTFGQLVAKQP